MTCLKGSGASEILGGNLARSFAVPRSRHTPDLSVGFFIAVIEEIFDGLALAPSLVRMWPM